MLKCILFIMLFYLMLSNISFNPIDDYLLINNITIKIKCYLLNTFLF